MPAFYSWTDNNDDLNGIRFSGVFGNLDRPTPSTVWRFNYMGKKIEAKIEDIFEPKPKEDFAVPGDWLAKVQVAPPPLSRVNTGTQGTRSGKVSAGVVNAAGTGNGSRIRAYELSDSYFPRSRSGSRSSSGSRHSFYDESIYGNGAGESEFNGDFWAFCDAQPGGEYVSKADGNISRIERQQGQIYADMAGFDLADRAERRMAQESLLEEDEGEVVTVKGMRLVDEPDEFEDPVGDISAPGGPVYEALCEEHGEDVADAYWGIELEMTALEGKDELLGVLAGDMINMIEDSKAKLDLLRSVYGSLDEASRERLATNGF